jgi:outer membrane protein TolC
MSLRPDLAAAVREEQAANVLLDGAETNLRPRVDLNASAFVVSLGQTGVLDSFGRWAAPSQTTSLQVEKPIGNNLFAGQLAQRQAESNQRAITSADLARQARLNVLQATGSLQDAIAAVQQAEAAVALYQATIDAEVQRFQIGEATLIDTVQTEQQQTDALLTLVSARQQLADIIAELRFQTGTLLQDGTAARRNLLTVPGPASRP